MAPVHAQEPFLREVQLDDADAVGDEEFFSVLAAEVGIVSRGLDAGEVLTSSMRTPKIIRE